MPEKPESENSWLKQERKETETSLGRVHTFSILDRKDILEMKIKITMMIKPRTQGLPSETWSARTVARNTKKVMATKTSEAI